MTGLVLVAASGLAREVLAVVRDSGRFTRFAVLDDAPERWGTELDGVRVEGGLDLVRDHPDEQVLVCAGRGTVRRSLVSRLALLGVAHSRFATVVHPGVEVPASCRVGGGSVLLAQVVLTADVTVGSHVVVMPHVTLTHDVELGDYATVCAGVSLGGSVLVEPAAYLGMNSSVREGLRVGEGATLGMGAALVTHLPAGEMWAGVPARPRRQLREAR